MNYVAKDFASELVLKVANVSLEDSLKWFKDDSDKLISMLVDFSIKSGYDLRKIDMDDEIDIPDDVYNKFGDELIKVWDSLSMYIGGSILLWFFRDTVLEDKSEEGINYAIDRLEDVFQAIGIPNDEEYQKRIKQIKNEMKMKYNKP